jgi:ComF family protein
MLKELTAGLVDILYPKSCHVCSRLFQKGTISFDDYLCRDCFLDMKKASCASYSPYHPDASPYQSLLACYLYEGGIKELIHKFKYENRPYLSKTISRLINSALEGYGEALFNKVDCLVPVPLHPVRQREREFNQSDLIAKELSREFKRPVCRAIKRIKNTKPQNTLDKTSRLSNLKDAFVLCGPFSLIDKHVLLIDDVVTTTATVTEAARTLKKRGVRKISVLAFARG